MTRKERVIKDERTLCSLTRNNADIPDMHGNIIRVCNMHLYEKCQLYIAYYTSSVYHIYKAELTDDGVICTFPKEQTGNYSGYKCSSS